MWTLGYAGVAKKINTRVSIPEEIDKTEISQTLHRSIKRTIEGTAKHAQRPDR